MAREQSHPEKVGGPQSMADNMCAQMHDILGPPRDIDEEGARMTVASEAATAFFEWARQQVWHDLTAEQRDQHYPEWRERTDEKLAELHERAIAAARSRTKRKSPGV